MIFNLSGGGAALNFRVIGGTAQPSSAADNTIWVNTSEKITSWMFSFAEPAAPEEGMVWITLATTGVIGLNALKRNGIELHPISASQYIGGAWQIVTAMIWQDGAWTEWWDGYLYKPGDECTAVGGEWISEAVPISASGDASVRTITKGADSLSVAGVGGKGTIIRKTDPITLTGKKTLEFEGELYNPASTSPEYWASICIWTSIGTHYQQNVAAVYHQKSGTSSGTITLDISSLDPGDYYVGFGLYGGSTLKMTALRVK